jgi:protein-S-isoprenylcysteine O-methyltransferase Ste14
MNTRDPIQSDSRDNRQMVFDTRQLIRFFIFSFLTPAVTLIAAWDATWLMGWILIILIGVPAVITRLIILRKNPELLHERGNYRQQEGNKSWDLLYASIVGMFGPLVVWITAGLDRNFGWSVVPGSVQWSAVIILVLCVIFSNWALVTNKYFSAVVRIQKDRNHTVITHGPYRFIRHPGYAGGLLSELAMPLMLGSLWALIPAILTMAVLILRTAKEDQTLLDELPGYAEYAKQTPYRLLPGIW